MSYLFMGQPDDEFTYNPDWVYGNISYDEPWSFDWNEKVIFYTGNGDKLEISELYSFIIEKFDDVGYIAEPMPMIAVTPQMAHMQNDWELSEDSIKYLKNGSIEQNGEIYSDVVVLGSTPPTVVSKLHIYNVTKTTEVMDEEEYHEMLRIDNSKDLVISDRALLVHYALSMSTFQGGPIVIPNPLGQLSSLKKDVLSPHYDTDLLGLPC